MRHSEWDIWKEKLDELPVNSDAELSWGAMQSVLDKNMPIVSPPAGGGSVVKLMVKKIVSALGYVLPAAAMVAAVTYMTIKDPKPEVQTAKKHGNRTLPQLQGCRLQIRLNRILFIRIPCTT